MTITLQAVPGGATKLTLTHERLERLAAAMPHIANNVQVGWELVLEKLAVTLQVSRRDTDAARWGVQTLGASREPLAWQNSRLLAGDLAESVAALKNDTGNDLLVIGSTELAGALLEHDLVDEIRLMIDPVMLGSGKRFFRDDGVCRRLALMTSETTSTGAILATYTRSVAKSAERPPRPAART